MYYIYKIENIVNHKKYIGLTNNVARRRARHFTDLRRNCHDNSFLQSEFNKYGEENFIFNVEFEGDIFEATNLTHEAKMITNEILIIFQEIIAEAYQVIKLAMQQAKNEMIQNEILDEKNEIIEKEKEIQEEKVEEIKEEVKEEIPHKTVRKPQRSRGRVNRK